MTLNPHTAQPRHAPDPPAGLFATSGSLVLMPVRHHSPACARAVVQLAQQLRPAAILVEGPSDFNERLDELYLPHTLPIAIYSYVRLDEQARLGAFYPFCEHSPEWQALLVGRKLGAAVRFIDMPWADLATRRTATHRYADRELRTSPYIPTLCQKLGVEDFDSLWDRLLEVDPRLTAEQVLERVGHFCYYLRMSGSHVPDEDLRREAFMADQVRAAQQEFNGPILVITGGYHSYGLFELLFQDKETRRRGDEEFVAHLPISSSPALPIATDRGIALTPFTDERLDSLTGYEAGMPSPGFYRQVWQARAAGRGDIYRNLLADAVATLRKRGQTASTADLIAVETSARALAALRGHAEVWRQDVIDAITGALIKEAIEPDTRHPFLDALLAVLRGDQRGKLAAGVVLPPLVHDIQSQLQTHDLEPQPKPRTVRLELTLPADLARSRVLHRLRMLSIRGFERRGGSDFVGRADLTIVWEEWLIAWSPDFDAGCIEAAIYGTTLLEAATARLLEQLARIERSAQRAALLLLDACLMGLSAPVDELLERLMALVRQDADFFSVAAALSHMLYLYRYDETLGTLGRTDIGDLLAETFGRACWLLETLGQPQGQDRELLRAFTALVQTFEACEQSLALDRAEFGTILRRAAANQHQRALVRGAANGALWTLHQADTAQVRTDLRACAVPDQIGDFLTGLFALARETAQRHPDFMSSIDELVLEFDDEAYLQALPAMRLAFSFFTPREKHYIAQTLL
nr:DUF5682 family protein [Chloroflexaceae bacterium]